ncbi:fluoride efflux transporter CrcB [Alteribacter keqinensis]|uniref:Fluoride-specific ion channel FluC n=1 Tax=Alteribacter keqinensis TaxID=2483800 RepID=A0A3M7TSP9_9BACI|nr:fluoride efflux transporter CrcB [Alteribacter keqinensis]RNA68537.1 fluoride efflux transporter CrcB [Alteribacter keqinensis]
MFNLLLVSIGGGLGAVSRFLLGVKIQQRYPDPPIPVAMLTVNLSGSLGLGVFFGALFGGIPVLEYNNPWFLLLGVGYFGAFTTFSTFSVEAATLLHDAEYKKAFVYIGLSIAGSVAAFIAGIYWFI